jgi:hypothetical protein
MTTLEPGLALGLSEAEKDDLESLIRSVREDVVAPDESVGETSENQWRDLNRRLGRLAAAVLAMEEKVRLLSEIARLTQERNEFLEGCGDRRFSPEDGNANERTRT